MKAVLKTAWITGICIFILFMPMSYGVVKVTLNNYERNKGHVQSVENVMSSSGPGYNLLVNIEGEDGRKYSTHSYDEDKKAMPGDSVVFRKLYRGAGTSQILQINGEEVSSYFHFIDFFSVTYHALAILFLMYYSVKKFI
ncbi:hypothetical protein LVD15_11860 [Fulvivirga maritima]|uniref:hypothetical protein n=1 Tax=Fulvivirga maritima TaxID=2904247 RepID=UPI001F2E60AA|nr:hypothetical protein [Fulvivirga maritima]UII29091.1 hypothetical protein LVD15_11860 [Fulvivirga maritima]